MKLHEYQAKELLKKYGISCPGGIVVDNPASGLMAAQEIGFPSVIKAQVYAGEIGRASCRERV